jgi:serine/threonine protein kinase
MVTKTTKKQSNQVKKVKKVKKGGALGQGGFGTVYAVDEYFTKFVRGQGKVNVNFYSSPTQSFRSYAEAQAFLSADSIILKLFQNPADYDTEIKANKVVYDMFNKKDKLSLTTLHPSICSIEIFGEFPAKLTVMKKCVSEIGLINASHVTNITYKDLFNILKQALQFLDIIHENNYIHKDIKQQNILLECPANVSSQQFVVSDYGSMLYVDEATRLSPAGSTILSPYVFVDSIRSIERWPEHEDHEGIKLSNFEGKLASMFNKKQETIYEEDAVYMIFDYFSKFYMGTNFNTYLRNKVYNECGSNTAKYVVSHMYESDMHSLGIMLYNMLCETINNDFSQVTHTTNAHNKMNILSEFVDILGIPDDDNTSDLEDALIARCKVIDKHLQPICSRTPMMLLFLDVIAMLLLGSNVVDHTKIKTSNVFKALFSTTVSRKGSSSSQNNAANARSTYKFGINSTNEFPMSPTTMKLAAKPNAATLNVSQETGFKSLWKRYDPHRVTANTLRGGVPPINVNNAYPRCVMPQTIKSVLRSRQFKLLEAQFN